MGKLLYWHELTIILFNAKVRIFSQRYVIIPSFGPLLFITWIPTSYSLKALVSFVTAKCRLKTYIMKIRGHGIN